MKTQVTESNSTIIAESTYMHTCGETIRVCQTKASRIIFKDSSGTIISVCPDCMKDIEIWDLNRWEPWMNAE